MTDAEERWPNIIVRLRNAVSNGGGTVVFHGNGEPRRLEVEELYRLARIRGGRLAELGVGPGARIGVLGPNAPDWIAWAYATWMRGATLVPLPVPLRVRDRTAVSAQLTALVTGFECTYVAAHERMAPLLPSEMLIPWEDAGSSASALDEADMVIADTRSLATILPTSGSTSAPKGVARSYRAVNGMQLASIMNPIEGKLTRHLAYSPLSHGGGGLALYAPLEPWMEFNLLATDRFARDPGELFRLVGPYGITTLVAASSGVAAAVRAIERNPTGVDLSSLTWLCFCFEMVDPDVLDRLLEVGDKFGLDPGVVGSYYGLSEGGGTRTPRGEGIRVDELDLEDLVSHEVAVPARPGRASKRVPSCGPAFGMELRIAGAAGALPEREIGEVQFRGQGLMRGYVGPGAEEGFDAEGWMHTGDVGYLADGEVFLTGRIKEVLVRQGKKYHPEDIERAAAVGAGVSQDECVAFAPLEGDEGEIIVVLEAHEGDLDAIEQRVRAAVINKIGITLRLVIFVAPQTLPKTSSGKAQRLAVRDQYARGELELVK